MVTIHDAILWEPRGGRTACLLCPHACVIADGHEGVCGVRRNAGGILRALTYGRVSSIAVDPIEKKPVYHYFPGTLALSLGSVGCTMRCGHCQNWLISRAGPQDAGLQDLAASLVPDMAEKHGCLGVAFTYNEPVVWIEYVIDVARACRERGLYTVMVTNGWITEAGLDMLGPLIDVWRVDVKGFSDEEYRSLCQVPRVAPVLVQAERAKRRWGMHVEVVTNIVPGVNDSPGTLAGIATWVRDALGPETPWHVTRSFPCLDMADGEPTPLATLRAARQAGLDAGLHFVFVGNVDGGDAEDSLCPACGARALRRRGYVVLDRATRDGACAACGTPLGIVE